MLRQEVDKLKTEFDVPEKEEDVPKEIPYIPPVVPVQEKPLNVRMVENMGTAQNDVNSMMRQLFTPVKIMHPWEVLEQARQEMSEGK